MSLPTEYDILSALLTSKIASFIFKDMDDMLSCIVASHTRPKREDFQFASYLLSLYLLRTCGVKLDTTFEDLDPEWPEIQAFFKACDDLKLKVFSNQPSKIALGDDLDEGIHTMLRKMTGNKKHEA